MAIRRAFRAEVRCHPQLSGPTDNASREQVNNNTKIQPTLMSSDVGDVSHAGLVRSRHLEALLQLVLCYDCRLAAIATRTTSVTDLDRDAGQVRPARPRGSPRCACHGRAGHHIAYSNRRPCRYRAKPAGLKLSGAYPPAHDSSCARWPIGSLLGDTGQFLFGPDAVPEPDQPPPLGP